MQQLPRSLRLKKSLTYEEIAKLIDVAPNNASQQERMLENASPGSPAPIEHQTELFRLMECRDIPGVQRVLQSDPGVVNCRNRSNGFSPFLELIDVLTRKFNSLRVDMQLIKCLLDYGADANATGNHGDNAWGLLARGLDKCWHGRFGPVFGLLVNANVNIVRALQRIPSDTINQRLSRAEELFLMLAHANEFTVEIAQHLLKRARKKRLVLALMIRDLPIGKDHIQDIFFAMCPSDQIVAQQRFNPKIEDLQQMQICHDYILHSKNHAITAIKIFDSFASEHFQKKQE